MPRPTLGITDGRLLHAIEAGDPLILNEGGPLVIAQPAMGMVSASPPTAFAGRIAAG
jgi:hypothetical protein